LTKTRNLWIPSAFMFI